ncbi:MAG: hypothetical protein U1E25_16040 [Methylocystis sp.]
MKRLPRLPPPRPAAKEMKEEQIARTEAEEAELTHNTTRLLVEEEKKVQAQPVVSAESAAFQKLASAAQVGRRADRARQAGVAGARRRRC